MISLNRIAMIVYGFKVREYSFTSAMRMLEAAAVSEVEAKKLLTPTSV